MDYLQDIISGFKKTLKLATDEEDDVLNEDIKRYIEIINSNKYADSNSDTSPVEKLLTAMQEKHNGENLDNQESDMVDGQQNKSLAFGKAGFIDRCKKHKDLLEELEKSHILPGQPVFQRSNFGGNFFLPQYKVPKFIFEGLELDKKHMLKVDEPLNINNYCEKFKNLLWIEEAHQAIEWRQYDMNARMIGKCKDFFTLVVPGLAEGRPSLMRGDRLIISSEARSTKYEGYIYEVREKDILFKIHTSVNNLEGQSFEIMFLASRTSYRRCHFGLENFRKKNFIKSIVFPIKNKEDSTKYQNCDKTDLRLFSEELNIYQRNAVANILKAHCRPAPYIVFGPPGTGKSVTLVEAILQIYARRQDSRILVCGNSNSCADLLAERIKYSGVLKKKTHLVRLSAFYRMENLIPKDIEDITVDGDTLRPQINDFRIIVTTCIQSGCLYEFNIGFDYVFIDEAGHANEPEALLSIGLAKSEFGCVVLAGDFHQLGPVVCSKIAKFKGLGVSMLERLSRRSIYQQTCKNSKMVYDEKYITKLLISYRSDPRVLQVSNSLFYDNELKFVIKTPRKWLDMFNFPSPLVFHPTHGRDRREPSNPSWFNPNEAFKVLFYVRRLYSAGLKPNQLGIITPYRRQIDKLYLLFKRCDLDYCKIGTMEEFQGDEREVIIISTVRVRSKNLEVDKKYNLGFLFDYKRFNVAVSRAKWLCIVIGEPAILKTDPCWEKFLQIAYNLPVDNLNHKDSLESNKIMKTC